MVKVMVKAIQKGEIRNLFQLGLLLIGYSFIQGPIDDLASQIAPIGRIVFGAVIFILVLVLFKFNG